MIKIALCDDDSQFVSKLTGLIQSLLQNGTESPVITTYINPVVLTASVSDGERYDIYILDVEKVGVKLLHNLLRKYYPLNNRQILKYETCLYSGETKKKVVNAHLCIDSREWRYITNLHVLQRKGEDFSMNNILFKRVHKCYRTTVNSYTTYTGEQDLFFDSLNKRWRYIYEIDFMSEKQSIPIDLVNNHFIKWNWNLIKRIYLTDKKDFLSDSFIGDILQNDGFFAQMGINSIEETLDHLQSVIGTSFEITEEMRSDVVARLKQKGLALYSYLPINKDFILQHQNKLDWKILQKNPRIQWDWELLNLYLRKIKETVSEDKQAEYLLGSKAMYAAIENYLNDDILSDIEKLYNIV